MESLLMSNILVPFLFLSLYAVSVASTLCARYPLCFPLLLLVLVDVGLSYMSMTGYLQSRVLDQASMAFH